MGRACLLLSLFAVCVSANALASNYVYPSDFSELVQRMGGEIPFPPEKLVQQFLNLLPDSDVVAAVFPHGRSLERTFTDFSQPRMLLATEFAASRPGEAFGAFRVFVGYTPRLHELEVISWNWYKRQYDFSIVSNYQSGKKSTIQAAYRPLCVSCHQQGGPIFPVQPWSETAVDGEVRGNLTHANNLDPFAEILLNLNEMRFIEDSAEYDGVVRISEALINEQRACMSLCRDDVKCRTEIIRAAFMPNSDKYFTEDRQNQFQSRLEKNFKDEDYLLPISIFSDRDVSSSPLTFTLDEDPLATRVSEGIARDGLSFQMIAEARHCFNISEEDIAEVSRLGVRAENRFESNEMKSLVQNWIPTGEQVMNVLRGKSVALTPPSIHFSPPVRALDPSHGLFLSYCGSCHFGASPLSRIMLPLDDLNHLKSYVSASDPARTVKAVLEGDKFRMPPRGAPQPTESERSQMLRELGF